MSSSDLLLQQNIEIRIASVFSEDVTFHKPRIWHY